MKENVKRTAKPIFQLLCGCVAATVLVASTAESRLIAGLPAEQTSPSADVKISGFVTLFGNKRVILSIQNSRDTVNPHHSSTLTEGQTDGSVEVLQIDEKAETVRIKNSGQVTVLSLAKNGVSLPSLPALSPLPAPVQSTEPGLLAASDSAGAAEDEEAVTRSKVVVIGRNLGRPLPATFASMPRSGSELPLPIITSLPFVPSGPQILQGPAPAFQTPAAQGGGSARPVQWLPVPEPVPLPVPLTVQSQPLTLPNPDPIHFLPIPIPPPIPPPAPSPVLPSLPPLRTRRF